ncbi:MAG: virulence protein E [Bacteroidales bacterium]|nr:virulence protein E [Bacteroidales bacterium]
MLQFGRNISHKDDLLEKISPQRIYEALVRPRPDVEARIRQLRTLRSLDQNQYRNQKKLLPYFVCGIFHPPYRQTQNFGFIEFFVLDIDHLSEKGLSPSVLKSQLITDSRLVMAFISPGEDGLKLMFRLAERCYDSAKFSLFYKCFAREFAMQFQLEQVIDSRTSDVTRACFFSIDQEAYYNDVHETIQMSDYVRFDNMQEVLDIQLALEHGAKEQAEVQPRPDKQAIDSEAFNFIRSKLNPKIKQREKPEVFVPVQLDQLMQGLQNYLIEGGIELYEVVNIHYGKKLKMKAGGKLAETNLFYGKRGFSVVQSPRTGTSAELNQLVYAYIQQFIDM